MLRRLVLLLAAAAAVAVVARLAGSGVDPVYLPYPDPARAAVSGRVLDPTGAPVAGVEVDWMAEVGRGVFQGSSAAVRSGPDGSFRLEGLAPGRGYVAVAGDDALVEGDTGRVTLRAGEEASAVDLPVEEVPARRRVAGRVLRSDGTPVEGVWVRAERSGLRGSWSAGTTTDAAGAFTLVAPWAGGECQVTLRPPGGAEVGVGAVPVGAAGLALLVP